VELVGDGAAKVVGGEVERLKTNHPSNLCWNRSRDFVVIEESMRMHELSLNCL